MITSTQSADPKRITTQLMLPCARMDLDKPFMCQLLVWQAIEAAKACNGLTSHGCAGQKVQPRVRARKYSAFTFVILRCGLMRVRKDSGSKAVGAKRVDGFSRRQMIAQQRIAKLFCLRPCAPGTSQLGSGRPALFTYMNRRSGSITRPDVST